MKKIFSFFFFHFFVFVFFRLIFYWVFYESMSFEALIPSFFLGLRFDLRLAVIITFIYSIYLLFYRRFPHENIYRLGSLVFLCLGGLVLLCYAIDIGYYAYLHVRLEYSIMTYFEDWSISYNMLKQTYPIWSILSLILLFTFSYWIFLNKYYLRFILRLTWGKLIFLAVLALGGVWGNISRYPLRWSQAYNSPNGFATAMGLNPVLFFFETQQLLVSHITENERQKAKEQIVKYVEAKENLGAVEKEKLQFQNTSQPLNVVVIVMESLAAHKSSLFGNRANATPFLAELAKESLFYSRYYAAAEGTARSIFALMTSVPDTMPGGGTASRNPRVVKRDIPLHHLRERDYQFAYFLGGSSNWAQIRSIFTANLTSLKIFEEGSYPEKKVVDVWGISDLDLLQSANDYLTKMTTPFFAVVQLAGFHRPYTIPEERHGFELRNLNSEELERAGFNSNAELNSMAFSDWSVKKYFEVAKKSNYYPNTVFVIIGDHGLPCLKADNISVAVKELETCKFHTPMIVHSPLLRDVPKEVRWPISEIDIVPSVIKVIDPNYELNIWNHDLFSSSHSILPVFMFYTYTGEYGILNRDDIFVKIRPDGQSIFRRLVGPSATLARPVSGHLDSEKVSEEKSLMADDPQQSQLSELAKSIFIWHRSRLYNTKLHQDGMNKPAVNMHNNNK